MSQDSSLTPASASEQSLSLLDLSRLAVQLLTLRHLTLLQRILKVEYEFPPHVKASKECRDMLAKILVPDPAKRMTVPQIQDHVWYRKDLPPGVAEMNDNLPMPGSGLQVSREVCSTDAWPAACWGPRCSCTSHPRASKCSCIVGGLSSLSSALLHLRASVRGCL